MKNWICIYLFEILININILETINISLLLLTVYENVSNYTKYFFFKMVHVYIDYMFHDLNGKMNKMNGAAIWCTHISQLSDIQMNKQKKYNWQYNFHRGTLVLNVDRTVSIISTYKESSQFTEVFQNSNYFFTIHT